jgi:hypothetical protein
MSYSLLQPHRLMTIIPLVGLYLPAVGCGEGLHSPGRANSWTDVDALPDPVVLPPPPRLPAPDLRPPDDTPPDSPLSASRSFPVGEGGTFEFENARLTASSQTFDRTVLVSMARGQPSPRPGPAAEVYQVVLSPPLATRVPARFRLRVPAGSPPDEELQLAYFKPKPEDPPGLWIPCQTTVRDSENHTIEGIAPGFDRGEEHFALLRRCLDSITCGPLLACISTLCQ